MQKLPCEPIMQLRQENDSNLFILMNSILYIFPQLHDFVILFSQDVTTTQLYVIYVEHSTTINSKWRLLIC